METWILFAIWALLFSGLSNFWMKVIAKNNYNTSLVTVIAYFTAVILSGIYYFSKHWLSELFTNAAIIAALLWIWYRLFMHFSLLSKVDGLKSIDTTIFYPLYMTFFSLLMTLVSFIYFWETLLPKEIVWVAIWIIIPLFLITKSENKIQINLKRWLFFTVITSIFVWIWTSFSKILTENNLDIDLYVFSWFIFWTFISLTTYLLWKNKNNKKYSNKWIFPIWFLLWIATYLLIYTYTSAMEWNLAIVSTITSFSILIPIILSVIFYKEEMTYKKAFVIFLSIVSIILFI